MFKRGLLVEPRPLYKDWEKKTRFGLITGAAGRISI
jgi:hypothetical protein